MAFTRSTKSRQREAEDSHDYFVAFNSPAHSPDSIMMSIMHGGRLAHSRPGGDLSTATGLHSSTLNGNPSGTTPRLRLHGPLELGSSSDAEYEPEESGTSPSDSEHEEDEKSEGSCRARCGQATPKQSTPERHPNVPKSKLALKMEERRAKGIELDANGARKGTTRNTNLGLEYMLDGQFIPAVYHADIRRKLLQFADTLGTYDEEPARGLDELDRTAFKQDQKHWRLSDRNRRPEVLTYWEQPDNSWDYDIALWYDNGRIVIDTDCRPLRLYPELPLTISGQCEGSRMEAWRRLNPKITMNDIKARMGWNTSKGEGRVTKPIKTPALANRMVRDRCRMGIKGECRMSIMELNEYILMKIGLQHGTQKKGPRSKSIVYSKPFPKPFRERSSERTQRGVIGILPMRKWNISSKEIRQVEPRAFFPFSGNSPKRQQILTSVSHQGTPASLAKAAHRLLDNDTRKKIEEKKESAKSKKMDDLNSVMIHEVVEEALSKPGKIPARPDRSTPSTPFPPAGHPNVKNERDENMGEHGVSELIAVQHRLGSRENPYSFEATAPQPRNSPFEAVKDSNVHNDHRSGVSNGNGHPLQRVPRLRVCPDFRFRKPDTVNEITLVQEALDVSRKDYERYIGFPPTFTTDRLQPYAYQLSELQGFFVKVYPGQNPPGLQCWGPMSSFDGFKARQRRIGNGDQGSVHAESGVRDQEGNTVQ
ncbi:MAG: hypothetical protein Q9171_001532 [Xanthocarpia ochracea]